MPPVNSQYLQYNIQASVLAVYSKTSGTTPGTTPETTSGTTPGTMQLDNARATKKIEGTSYPSLPTPTGPLKLRLFILVHKEFFTL